MEFEVSSTVNDSETVSASLPQFCSCLFIKLLFNDTVSRCKVLICSISFLMSHPFLLVLGSLNAKLKKVLATGSWAISGTQSFVLLSGLDLMLGYQCCLCV